MIYLRLFFMAGTLAASVTFAAEESSPAKGSEKRDQSSLVTNVVGSQEAPTVLNVVPWKDREVKYERKSPISAILDQTLQPLDRDVLTREIQYHNSLQEQGAQ